MRYRANAPRSICSGILTQANGWKLSLTSLATHPDPTLQALADDLIDAIAGAQQEDGYLNTYFPVLAPESKWANLRDWHEMYNAGHLIEGAVAYFKATGKRKMLDVLQRFADHIDATFGPADGKARGYPGHPELELALVKALPRDRRTALPRPGFLLC